MKFLVTGSQGFIGSYLCSELLAAGHTVVGIDNFSKYGVVSRPHDNHANFDLIVMDAQHLHLDKRALSVRPDMVIAGAALIGGISYFHKYAYDLLAINERITASTFDYSLQQMAAGSLKRIIVMSSSMVFESTDLYPTPEEEVRRCPAPLSTYGFQKLATEYFAKGAWEQYKLPFTIIRPFNCIGVGEEEALGDEPVMSGNLKLLMSHVVPDLIYKALRLKPSDGFPVLGSGDQVRHYTNGKDIARAIRLAAESEKAINEDFNISHERATAVTELAEIIWKKIHGNNPSLIHEKPFQYDVQVRSPSVEKAKRILGFSAEHSLEDTLDEVILWTRKHYEIG
jgi:UDP-glucose 4-epimerase